MWGKQSAAIVLWLPVSVVATESTKVPQDDALFLEPVVVTATKIERPASELPETTAVFDDRQIRQMYNRDLSDVLQRAAGVDVDRQGTNGVAIVNIRGLGEGRASTLIDGQFADFLDGGIGNRSPIQTVDWDNVDRVEIVRGAGSALYGPMAMGGVVNVITKEPPKGPNVTRPFVLVDTLPTFGGGFTSGGTLDQFGYFLDFKHLDSDGYRANPEPAFYPGAVVSGLHSLAKGWWNKTQVGGQAKWTINDRADLKFGFNFLDDHNNAFERFRTPYNGQIGRYALDYSHWLTDNDQLTVNLTYRDHQTDLTADSYLFSPVAAYNNPDTSPYATLFENARKLSGEIRNRWDIAAGHTLLVGFYGSQDWAHRKYVTPFTNVVTDRPLNDISNYSIYGQYELALWDRLFITMGGRGDWFAYDLRNPALNSAAKHDFSVFNPRGGVRVKVTDEFSLRGTVGTGFRPPDPYSLISQQYGPFYEFRANPNLKPEYSNSYDLGLDISTPFGTRVAATGYYNELTDYLQAAVTMEGSKTISQIENVGRVYTYGAELEIQQKFTEHLGLFVNYTHSIAEAGSNSPPNVSGLPEKGRQLPLTPKNKAAFGLVYESDRLSGRLEGRYVDRSYIYGDTKNDPAYALGSYITADFRVTYRHPLGEKQRLDVSIGARNLFDRRYEVRFINTYAEPRVGFLQVGYQF